ncbi:MAG: hypothetical protein RIG82_09205 [Phycisphaeraceae bacterium]
MGFCIDASERLEHLSILRSEFESDPGPSVIALLKDCTLGGRRLSPLEAAALHLLSGHCGVRLDSLDDLWRLGAEIADAEDELRLYRLQTLHGLSVEPERSQAVIRKHEAQEAYDEIVSRLAKSFERLSKHGGVRLSASGPAAE